jgi:hypothetical protein
MDGVKVRDEKRVVGSIYAAERRRTTEGFVLSHADYLNIASPGLPMGSPQILGSGPC